MFDAVIPPAEFRFTSTDGPPIVCARWDARGRHEMLNEVNRNEVRTNLLAWISELLPAPADVDYGVVAKPSAAADGLWQSRPAR